MELYEEAFDDNYSDFDDRVEELEYYFNNIKDESKPLREDDLYYRTLDEY